MGADEKDEAMNTLRACISSRKGGVPFHELNMEYKELVGEYIPFGRLGYENLLSFLRDVPGVTVDEKDCKVRTVPTATTKHLHDLINKQKDTVKKFKTRYRPYKNTQQNQPKPSKPVQKAPLHPTKQSNTNTQPNQPKPKPLQKAPLHSTKQSNNSHGSYSQTKPYLGQYPYQQQIYNEIYEKEFWLQFEELLMLNHRNDLWNNYESYWRQNQMSYPTYITGQSNNYHIQYTYPSYTAYNQQAAHQYMQPSMYIQNRYDTYDYYNTYNSKYPSQYNNRKQRKYQPYNQKFKGFHYNSKRNSNTFKSQHANINQSAIERYPQVQFWKGITKVQYKPFGDDSLWLSNDSMWSAISPEIGEYQVIGDALMLQLLGCSPSELCDYDMTIKEAIQRVTKFGCSNKVLIALGTIDILNGAGYVELTCNMQSLINTIVGAGGHPVICTVPPMSGVTGNYHAISARLTFNRWLWSGLKPQHVIDLNEIFYDGGRINFKLFKKPTTNFLISLWPLTLWTQDCMDLVSKRLNQRLTSGTGYSSI